MIELSSIQRNGSLYIVYDLAANPHPIDNISVNMINSNQKRSIGLSKISFDEENGAKKNILFDVTGMMPLSEFLRRNQTQESFRQFILAIIRSIESFDDYMISVEQVILDPDYVYINVVADQVNFLCLPFADGAGSGCDLHDFFKLICNISFSNVELHQGEISYFNYVLNVLQSKTAFSLDNLRQVLLPPSDKNEKHSQKPAFDVKQDSGMAVDQRGDQQMSVGADQRVWNAEQNAQNTTYGQTPANDQNSGGIGLAGLAGQQGGKGLGGFFPVGEKSGEESGGGFLKSLKKLFSKKEAEAPAFGGLGELNQNQGKQNTAQQPQQQFGMQPPQNEELNHTIYVPSPQAQNTQNTQNARQPQQAPFPGVQGVRQAQPQQQVPFPGVQGVQQAQQSQQVPFPGVQSVRKQNDTFSGAEIGGIAGQVEREKRAQNDLYTPQEGAQSSQQGNVFGGSMSGIKQEGLSQTPPEQPKQQEQTSASPFEDEGDLGITQIMFENDAPTKLIIPNDDPATTSIRRAWLISRRDGTRIELNKPM
ncbi:MAG: DUF6382 domain-containing protein, partial [Oscillospiraceae bacterium]|nr:DUF6382 domain-containing protein [Oscillospiraceae bacterium]